jgi:hypothetical protein
LPPHMASLDGRKPPTQRITNRGLCLTQATMTMIKHNPMNDPPQKTRKAFSQKQETPILGLQTFYPPIWLHPPKTRKAFSRKQETPILGLQTFHPYFVAPPKNTKSFFPETRNPDFGTCRGRNGPKWRPWSHFCIFTFYKFRTMYGLAFMCRKKFRNLPSAARFCAKRFRHIDFWTFLFVHFLKIL